MNTSFILSGNRQMRASQVEFFFERDPYLGLDVFCSHFLERNPTAAFHPASALPVIASNAFNRSHGRYDTCFLKLTNNFFAVRQNTG